MLNTVTDVYDIFVLHAATTLAVGDATGELFLVSYNPEGDLFYVGIPSGDDETGVGAFKNRGLLEDDSPNPRWPLTVLAQDGDSNRD